MAVKTAKTAHALALEVPGARPTMPISEARNRIRRSGSEAAYRRGDFLGHAWVTHSFPGDLPIYNSWQWDAVFADGAMFKHGNMFQGIFVDPGRDAVGVYFSTCPTYLDPDLLPGCIRQVSKRLAGQ